MVADSPPRERGTLVEPQDDPGQERLTPARAGNTRLRCPSVDLLRTHPRASGEHVLSIFHGVRVPDSPPRERGTRARYQLVGRVIVTHPRASGEHSLSRTLM